MLLNILARIRITEHVMRSLKLYVLSPSLDFRSHIIERQKPVRVQIIPLSGSIECLERSVVPRAIYLKEASPRKTRGDPDSAQISC